MAEKMLALWWWIDRWRKSTAYTDMTLEEQGAYRNLLDEATLRGGALPADERILAKACGDATRWQDVRAAVLARFDLVDGAYRNTTLDTVLHQSERRRQNQQNYRERRSGAVLARVTVRNRPDNAPGNATDNGPGNKPDSPDQDQEHKEHSTAAAPLQVIHRAVENSGPTDWKRAVAIAHAVMDTCPDSGDWTPEFKERCRAQGIDYGQAGGKDHRPLFARALDYVEGTRARRQAVSA